MRTTLILTVLVCALASVRRQWQLVNSTRQGRSNARLGLQMTPLRPDSRFQDLVRRMNFAP
jgi:hypothetical protein